MKRLKGYAFGAGALAAMTAAPVLAETTATSADFKSPPYLEDWSRYSDPGLRDGGWERLKFIPLGDQGRLSLGGELRPRVEWREHYRYGRPPEDSGVNGQIRTRVWADLRLTPSMRLFGELRHGESGDHEDGVLSPIDRSGLDLHQAFAEVGSAATFARVGRQEILLGRGRLFDVRDGTNTRRAFDAARFQTQAGDWRLGVMGGANLREKTGSFDDETNDDWRFVAAHAAHRLPLLGAASQGELLYVYTDRDAGPNRAFIGRRHTVSARVSARNGAWDWDVEAIGQTGETDDGRDISAWFLASEGAYQLQGPWSPRVGWRGDVGSGGSDPSGGRAKVYDALWSRAQSFVPDIGYSNTTAIGPSLALRPTSKFAVDGLVQGLWRTTRDDGVYTLSGAYLRRAEEGRSRYVGLRTVVKGEYRFTPHVATGFYVNHTKAGDFLKEAGSARDMTHATVYTTLRF